MTQDSTDRGVGEATPPPPAGAALDLTAAAARIIERSNVTSAISGSTTDPRRAATAASPAPAASSPRRSPASRPDSTRRRSSSSSSTAQRANQEGPINSQIAAANAKLLAYAQITADTTTLQAASRALSRRLRGRRSPRRRRTRTRLRCPAGTRLVGRQPHVQRRPARDRRQRPLGEHLHERHHRRSPPTARSCSRPAGRRSGSRRSHPTTRSRSAATRSR